MLQNTLKELKKVLENKNEDKTTNITGGQKMKEYNKEALNHTVPEKIEDRAWMPNGSVDSQLLAQHIIEEDNLILISDEALRATHFYLYEDGYYKEMSTLMVKNFIKNHIPAETKRMGFVSTVYQELTTEIPNAYIDDLNNNEDIINFENGLYSISKRELLPFTPEIMSTVRIPGRYIPDVKLSDAPVFNQFINTLTNGDVWLREIILEYMALCISNIPGYKIKKFLILTGPGNTGKTQLRELTEYLVGKRNTQSVELSTLCDKFGTGQAVGKRLIGSGDMPSTSIKDVGILKQMTGGDQLNAEQKFKDSFSYKFKGFLWFNCNELPQIKGDRGDHVFERFIIVPCTNVIPQEKRDPYILEKMKAEKDIIISFLVRYLPLIIGHGYRLKEGQSVQMARDNYRRKINSLEVFVDVHCDLHEGKISQPDFNQKYLEWCRKEQMYPIGKNSISYILKKEYGIRLHKSGGTNYYYLTLKDV